MKCFKKIMVVSLLISLVFSSISQSIHAAGSATDQQRREIESQKKVHIQKIRDEIEAQKRENMQRIRNHIEKQKNLAIQEARKDLETQKDAMHAKVHADIYGMEFKEKVRLKRCEHEELANIASWKNEELQKLKLKREELCKKELEQIKLIEASGQDVPLKVEEKERITKDIQKLKFEKITENKSKINEEIKNRQLKLTSTINNVKKTLAEIEPVISKEIQKQKPGVLENEVAEKIKLLLSLGGDPGKDYDLKQLHLILEDKRKELRLKKKQVQERIKHPNVSTSSRQISLDFGSKGNSGKQTTVEDLAKDNGNQKYLKHVTKILADIVDDHYQSPKVTDLNDTSLKNISLHITDVCRKIYRSEEIVRKKGFKMCPHPVQVLTILRLADEILSKTGKGAVGQVKTGEGKTFIISVLSIVLARFERKIDIVTSNLELAKRDQEEQKVYADLFGIGSGILYNRRHDKDFDFSKNTVSKMSFDDEDFSVEAFEHPIVYSTNSNFEFVYLHSLFRKNKLRTRPYDVVIVDEVDNMLLDQAMSPAIISKNMPIMNAEDIFKIVYTMRNYDVKTIVSTLQSFFPNYGGFKESGIQMLKDAAISSEDYIKNRDYIIKNGEIMIIDCHTNYLKPGSRWKGFIHEMVEIKENLKMKEPSISYCMITQNRFFNLYNRIAGVTGTVGDEHDERILKKEYAIRTFKIPRNIESKQLVMYTDRPNNLKDLYRKINSEIERIAVQGRSVLVIFDSIKNVDEFSSAYYPKAGTIKGIEPIEDRKAIETAGNTGKVTIATNAAGRGMDIKLKKAVIKNGGLHVIIPTLPSNPRMLEQAIGRCARQGQPGSATVYLNRMHDRFCKTPDFNSGYENLFDLQEKFAVHIRENWSFLYKDPKKYSLGEIRAPFQSSPEEVLKIAAQGITRCLSNPELQLTAQGQQILSDCILDMILSAWGIFFTELSENQKTCADKAACQRAYQEFLNKLHEWIPTKGDCLKTYSHIKGNAAKYAMDPLDCIEEVSSKVIGTIGEVLDIAMPNSMKEMLKNRVAQGILKTAGGIFEIKAGVALTIASGGTLTLGGLASAGFGLNNVYEGLQDIWHGARDEEIESYNPLKEFTNNSMNSTLDILNMGTGVYAVRAYVKNKGKVAERTAKSDLVDTDLYKNASKESIPKEIKSYPSHGKYRENLANEEKFFDFEGRRSSAAECSRQSSRWGSDFEFTPKSKGTGNGEKILEVQRLQEALRSRILGYNHEQGKFSYNETLGIFRAEKALNKKFQPSNTLGVDMKDPGGLGDVSLKGPFLNNNRQALTSAQQETVIKNLTKHVNNNMAVDVHIIDTLGLDAKVISGLKETLKSSRVKIIYLE